MPSSSAAMARPSSRPMPSASKPRKAARSPSPSPATAPKTVAGSARRRSPLSDLNSGDAASAARPGCFRFLLSTASSGTRSRSGSTPRTPTRPVDPKHRRRDRVPDQESRTRADRCATGQEQQRMKGPEPIGAQIRRHVPDTKKQWPATAAAQQEHQFEALTPEKKADSAPAPASSGATPPVHASISPEVAACGSATPACFAAGHHVVAGVGDRRKCRPRGILAIAEEGMTSSEDLDAKPSRASIRWMSSSPLSGQRDARTCSTKCGTEEASVNWLVSPPDEDGGAVDLLEEEIFVPRCSLEEDAFWHLSPEGATGLLGSPLLGNLLDFGGTPLSELSRATPSSEGFLPVQKTPSSGDSISPFSLIVKRASMSSRGSSLCAQQGLGSSCRHGTAAVDPPSVSWRGNVSNGMRSGLTRTSSRWVKPMDPVVEFPEMLNFSPQPGDADYDDGHGGALPDLSFQFAGAPTPHLESIDLTIFKRSPRDTESKGKETSFQKPGFTETRISWREGLVSRMFDICDLDSCNWLSDDEEAPVLLHNVETRPYIKIQPSSLVPHKQGDDHPAIGGFGSIEFSDIGDNNGCKACPKADAVAESMRAEGFELVASDDSDWTHFYKNDLFQK